MVKPYEGTEPYIFISYSHRDTDRVVPLLEAMERAGYRIWYDEGIEAGSRWTRTLAEKILNCKIFLPLLSRACVASDFCRRELALATEERKSIVPVHMESVTLPPEWRLLLVGIQYRRLPDFSGIDAFVKRLERDKLLAPCKASVTPEPEPAPVIPWNRDGEIRWYLDENGVLTIGKVPDSSGKMPDYEELYHIMFSAAENALAALENGNVWDAKSILIEAERKAEERYIENGD